MPVQTAIKIRRSSVASKIPLTTDLVLGELALNTTDGVLYFKKSPSGVDSIVAVATLDGTQTLTNKTLSSATLTGTLTAGGGVGTNGQVLQSTATGVQWATIAGSGGTTTNALTIGTGLSGTSFNGSTAVTIAIDSTVVTLTGTQTLTNKTLTLPVIDNIRTGYTSTATAAGTTTLTVASNHYQRFTGSTTQTIVLPVTSTLAAGIAYEIENASTGNLTVNSSGGNLVITIIPGVTVQCMCIGTTLTTAADWDSEYNEFSAITGTGSVVLSTNPTLVVTDTAFTLRDDADPTKQAQFQLSGITTGTTRTLQLPNADTTLIGTAGGTFSGGVTFSSTVTFNNASSSITASSLTTGLLTLGGASGTGTITLGQSTVSQTTKIQAGATASGSTKTINLGTGGLTGSTTTIDIGSTFGTTVTANGTWTYSGANAYGTPASIILTNATGLPVSGITASTSTALGVGSIELGHATDTTIARSSAGVVTIEGVEVVTLSRSQTLTNKTLSSAVITGTVTAGGAVGTAGQVLSSTGTGVQWVAASAGGGLSVDESIIYSMIF